MSITALLIITVLLPASSVNAGEIELDDSSASIVFSSGWQIVDAKATDPPEWGSYFGGSTHASSVQGSFATIPFNGTAIVYYGDTNTDHGVAQVTLDGNTIGELVNSTTSIYARDVALWTRTGLANTSHTLTITHAGPQGSWITLDHVMYTVEDSPVTVTTTTSPTSSPASSPASSPTATGPSKIPSGPIVRKTVGITLGIILVLLILLSLLLWRSWKWWRRRNVPLSENGSLGLIELKDPPQY